MDNSDDNPRFTPVLHALREGNPNQFDVHLRTLDDDEVNQLWQKAAAAHLAGEINLTVVLEQWLDRAPGAAFDLMEAMGHLTGLGDDDARRFLKFAASVPQSYRYSAAIVLAPAFRVSGGLAVRLATALLESGTLDAVQLEVWAIAYVDADAITAVELALAAEGTRSCLLVSQVLQRVDLSLPAVVNALMTRELNVIEQLLAAAQHPAEASVPWWVLARMSCFSPHSTNTVMTAISNGVDSASIGLANSLAAQSVPAFGIPQWSSNEIVFLLFSEAMRSERVRPAVDHALSILLHRPTTHAQVLEGLRRLGSNTADVETYFPRVFQTLGQKSNWTEWLITSWLVDETSEDHRLRDFISASAIGGNATLDARILGAASQEQRTKAARRLLALTHDGATLCGFISVFAEAPALQPGGVNLAGEMLDYALNEYPGAATEFLKDRTRIRPSDKPHSAMYREVYCNALRWRRVLKDLPKIQELLPEQSQTQALWALKRRFNRDVMRGAKAKSIFASFVTSVHVAQGSRAATHRINEPTMIFDLQQHSHSIELPASEVADPVGGSLRRARMLRDAK